MPLIVCQLVDGSCDCLAECGLAWHGGGVVRETTIPQPHSSFPSSRPHPSSSSSNSSPVISSLTMIIVFFVSRKLSSEGVIDRSCVKLPALRVDCLLDQKAHSDGTAQQLTAQAFFPSSCILLIKSYGGLTSQAATFMPLSPTSENAAVSLKTDLNPSVSQPQPRGAPSYPPPCTLPSRSGRPVCSRRGRDSIHHKRIVTESVQSKIRHFAMNERRRAGMHVPAVRCGVKITEESRGEAVYRRCRWR